MKKSKLKYSGIKDLALAYSVKFGTTKKEAEEVIKNVVEVMESEMVRTDKRGIQFINFLTLEKVQRKARIGRNPMKPEEEVHVPARISVKAKVGKNLFTKLNPPQI